MPLTDQIAADLKTSMLARDAARTSALRMVRAAFIELEKDGKGPVTDERCLDALRRLKKQREDAIAAYLVAGRADSAASERFEMELIEGYLPKLADEATTLGWVKEAIAASGANSAKEVGKAMGALMKTHKADVDATLARTLLTRELGG